MIRNDQDLASDLQFIKEFEDRRPEILQSLIKDGLSEGEANLLLEASDVFISGKKWQIELYEDLKKGIYDKENHHPWERALAMKILSGATLEEIGDYLGIDQEGVKRLEGSNFNSPDRELTSRMLEFFEAKIVARKLANP